MFFLAFDLPRRPPTQYFARRGVHERALDLNLDLLLSWKVPGLKTIPLGYRYGGMGNDDSEEEHARLTQSATYMIWLGIFLIIIMSKIGCWHTRAYQ